MIEFKTLEISGTMLIADIQISDMSFFEDVYIDTVCFDTQDTFIETGPSSKARVIYSADQDENIKKVNLSVDIDTLQDKLIIVYVITKGSVSQDAPCSMKNDEGTAVVYRKFPIYAQAVKGLKSFDCCDIPREFIDFILRVYAFELSVKVGNIVKAIEYWKRFFVNEKKRIKSGCGCHGKV